MKKILYILVLLLTLQIVSSATIQGNIYDLSLDKVKNSIVEINTIPKQTLVAKDGSYSFTSIPKGNYQITAHTPDDKLTTTEEITIEQDGTYNIDLFLIPELKDTGAKKSNSLYYILAIIILIIVLIKFRKKTKKEPEPEEKIDEDLDKVMDIIKKEGNRTTQKTIREKTGLSEAKVSLMVTELEDKGLVKRIKKGRANIVILKNE